MGVIKRQGIKQGIVNYVGVAIGFLATIAIYSLDTKIYGIARFLVDGATFLGAFAFLGVNSLVIRFFSEFKNETNGHNGFLPFILMMATMGFILFFGIVTLFHCPLLEFLGRVGMQPSLYWDYFSSLTLLCFILSMTLVVSAYTSNFQRIVIPGILTNLMMKVGLPVLILAYYWGWLDARGFINYFIVMYLIALIGLFIYLIYFGQLKLKFNWSFLTRDRLSRMGNYAFFNILGSIGSQMATRLDIIMVTSLIPGFSGTGVYGITVNIASVVEIPYRSFIKIASPIIAKNSHNGNKSEILDIYQRSSLSLMIVGLGIFLAVWVSIEDLFRLTANPEELIAGKYVFFYLGIAKVIDMTTGINSQIISFSRYYKFNVIAILILGVANIFTNYFLIPDFGIIGAAMATLIALGTFNLVKFLFVWIAFRMQPFTLSSLKVLFFAMLAFSIAYWIPSLDIPLLDMAIRSGIMTLVFGFLIIYFKVSADLSQLFWATIKTLRTYSPFK